MGLGAWSLLGAENLGTSLRPGELGACWGPAAWKAAWGCGLGLGGVGPGGLEPGAWNWGLGRAAGAWWGWGKGARSLGLGGEVLVGGLEPGGLPGGLGADIR